MKASKKSREAYIDTTKEKYSPFKKNFYKSRRLAKSGWVRQSMAESQTTNRLQVSIGEGGRLSDRRKV